jgi:hypothetical protein
MDWANGSAQPVSLAWARRGLRVEFGRYFDESLRRPSTSLRDIWREPWQAAFRARLGICPYGPQHQKPYAKPPAEFAGYDLACRRRGLPVNRLWGWWRALAHRGRRFDVWIDPGEAERETIVAAAAIDHNRCHCSRSSARGGR